jgi:hypothetical protein
LLFEIAGGELVCVSQEMVYVILDVVIF